MGCGSKTGVPDVGVEGYGGVRVDPWRFLEQGTEHSREERGREEGPCLQKVHLGSGTDGGQGKLHDLAVQGNDTIVPLNKRFSSRMREDRIC